MKKITIGFIGQGFVGKNLADNVEERGFAVVRFSLEPSYIGNKEKIKECHIVFVAVPTPSTPKGFDASLLDKVLLLVGKGKIAVIKSTVVPGATLRLQKKFKDIILLHSPEFLSEVTARHDTDHPFMNIVGMTVSTPVYQRAAQQVLSVFPQAAYSSVVTSAESEIIKYAHNCGGYVQIVFFNFLYDLAKKVKADWSKIEEAVKADPFIPNRYSRPVHKSGRGAGGHCFIKDFSAFIETYQKMLPQDKTGIEALVKLQNKNNELLLSSRKDLDLLKGVHGEKVFKKKKK